MGKRFTRITRRNYEQYLDQLSGQQAQVVDWSGRTYHGRLLRADLEGVSLQDLNAAWYNRKQHTHRLALDDIREIILDQVAPW
jgi:hypothetical protein